MKLSVDSALKTLRERGTIFTDVFSHGTLLVEVYKPQGVDLQTPHNQDEVYIVISGSGTFNCGGESTPFGRGDFLFVPAGVEHRFENFTDDFATWVIFYGPRGGETSLFTR